MEKLEVVRNFLVRTVEKLSKEILFIFVFGSVARQESTPDSDIDLYVVFKRTADADKVSKVVDETRRMLAKELAVNAVSFNDFLNCLIAGDPYVINAVSEARVLYDIGIFEAFRQLIYKGDVAPEKSTINLLLLDTYRRLQELDYFVEEFLTESIVENAYIAAISASQAYLISVGKMTLKIDEIPGNLVTSGVDTNLVLLLEQIIKTRKKIVHRNSSPLDIDLKVLISSCKKLASGLEALMPKITSKRLQRDMREQYTANYSEDELRTSKLGAG